MSTRRNTGVVDVDGFSSLVLVLLEVAKTPDTDVGATATGVGLISSDEGAFLLVIRKELFSNNFATTRALASANITGLALVDDGTTFMESVDSDITDLLVSVGDVVSTDLGAGSDVAEVLEVVIAFAVATRAAHGVGVDAFDTCTSAPDHLHAPGDGIAADGGVAEEESSTFFGVEVEVTGEEVSVLLESGDLANFLGEVDLGGAVGVFSADSLATELAIRGGVGITSEDADGLRSFVSSIGNLSRASPAHTTGGNREMTEGAGDLEFSI